METLLQNRNGHPAYKEEPARSMTGLMLRYYLLLRQVTEEGVPTETGHTLRNLTDLEAARTLDAERTSINVTRGSLMKRGLVSQHDTRRCRVSGNRVKAWGTGTPPKLRKP